MRVLGWMVLVLLLPGRGWATPEPPPPGDYLGAQYIDQTGCVFVRDQNGWTARLDKNGAPICGFPPSQPVMAATIPVSPPSPEDALADLMAQGLRAGDLLTDRPAEPPSGIAPDPAQATLDATLQDQIAIDARLRSAMAGQAPQGLCERLGYRSAGAERPVIGGDVTQGLCPGMVAPDTGPLLVQATAPEPAATIPAERPAVATAPDPKPAKDRPKRQPASVVARRPAVSKPEAPAQAEMIPAHARYVEIGIYADEGNALAALRRLSGMGYRTAQRDQRVNDKAGKAVLAGPFADRQALVSALARLRENGYPRAIVR